MKPPPEPLLIRMSIVYSPRQTGNPLLKAVPGVRLEQGDKSMKSDFLIGTQCAVLFLSLKYHGLHPEYIYKRVDNLGPNYDLRVLLVMADVENSPAPITGLDKLCVMRNLTLIVAWTLPEAGTYLASLRRRTRTITDKNAPVAIQKARPATYDEQLAEVLTTVPRINKADASQLSVQFKNFRNIVENAGRVEQLSGWGPAKSARFKRAMTEPFSEHNPLE